MVSVCTGLQGRKVVWTFRWIQDYKPNTFSYEWAKLDMFINQHGISWNIFIIVIQTLSVKHASSILMGQAKHVYQSTRNRLKNIIIISTPTLSIKHASMYEWVELYPQIAQLRCILINMKSSKELNCHSCNNPINKTCLNGMLFKCSSVGPSIFSLFLCYSIYRYSQCEGL